MKKILVCLIAILMLSGGISALAYGTNEAEDIFDGELVVGDVNTDGFINVKDLVRLKKYISGASITIDLGAANIAEQNSDVNSADILAIRDILLKK